MRVCIVIVRYSSGQKIQYFYNTFNQITKIEDSSGRTLEAKYGSNGDVIELAVDGGNIYNFRSAADRDARTAHIDVTGPKGEITQVTIQMSADESISSYTVATLGRQSKNGSPSKSSSTAKPTARVADMPTNGLAKDGVYTNNFFQFSMQFPQAWKILSTGAAMNQLGNGASLPARAAPPPKNSIVAAYTLFWGGTVDKQTQAQHWAMICAVKPAPSAPNGTPDKYLKVEADVAKSVAAEYMKKGETPPLTAGEVKEFYVSGKRMVRLDESTEINKKPATVVNLVTDEHGYLLLFMFSDPVGDESNYHAAKAISSLRFFGRAN